MVRMRTQVPFVPYFSPLSSPPSPSPSLSLSLLCLWVPLSVFVSISYSVLCVSFQLCDSLSISAPLSVPSRTVLLDHKPSELGAEATRHHHCPPLPSPQPRASAPPLPQLSPPPPQISGGAGRRRAGYPRGPLPSAPLPGGRDPSPLTSPAPPPRADISSGPAEKRAADARAVRALPASCPADFGLRNSQLGTPAPRTRPAELSPGR